MISNVTPLSLNAFLAIKERRAYRMALLATRNEAEALDIVQDAMLKLCQRYGDHGAEQWAPLFHRILQNRIMDWHRRQQRNQRWLMPWKKQDHEQGEAEYTTDGMDDVPDPRDQNPERLLSRAADVELVLKQVEALPIRQQQAFLLRVWEGLDVSATAQAMACSEGAVKSHFHRAIRSVRTALEQA